MATVHQKAARDQQLKLAFERKLKPTMDRLLVSVAKEVADAIAISGPAAAGTVATKELEILVALNKHYQDVGKVFSRQLTNRLPAALGVTGSERSVIEAELQQIFAQRASSQAQLIARTTTNNIQRSVTAQLAAAGDDALTNRELGRNVGTQLSRHFRKRAAGIAITETQNPAETSKAVEAEVVAPNPMQTTKEWVSQGDDLVRDSHLSADGQVKPLDMPYVVQGQTLMYPGDPAGSASNIVNCRCSSVVDETAIISQREA
jgi:hypothetical protein